MSRRRKLCYRNWNRYLWISMRSCERFYARESRWLLQQRHSSSAGSQSHSQMLAGCARLLLSYARSADSDRRMLGL